MDFTKPTINAAAVERLPEAGRSRCPRPMDGYAPCACCGRRSRQSVMVRRMGETRKRAAAALLAENRITLRRGDGCWLAEFTGPHAAEVRHIFQGSATAPTAFTPEADAAVVLAEIKRRNPGVIVEVA